VHGNAMGLGRVVSLRRRKPGYGKEKTGSKCQRARQRQPASASSTTGKVTGNQFDHLGGHAHVYSAQSLCYG
jgi:hypothetical protein